MTKKAKLLGYIRNRYSVEGSFSATTIELNEPAGFTATVNDDGSYVGISGLSKALASLKKEGSVDSYFDYEQEKYVIVSVKGIDKINKQEVDTPLDVIDIDGWEIVDIEGNKWVRSQEISYHLGYARSDAVTQIYNKHKDWFQDGKDTVILKTRATDGKEYETRCFSFTGGWKICQYSNMPKADEVMQQLEALIKKMGTDIEEYVDEISDTKLVPYIESHSRVIQNERVICDFDLAPIYGVSVRDLNRAYKRNLDMFEDDWVIQLNDKTWNDWCQSGTGSKEQLHRSEPPLIYKPEGAHMAGFQLRQSPIARKRAITIIKVFSDLERMAHGEEPKQPGFSEFMQVVTKQSEMMNENINQLGSLLTTGILTLGDKVDKDIKKVDGEVEKLKAQVRTTESKLDDLTSSKSISDKQKDIGQLPYSLKG